jgi:hypothetical protein
LAEGAPFIASRTSFTHDSFGSFVAGFANRGSLHA